MLFDAFIVCKAAVADMLKTNRVCQFVKDHSWSLVDILFIYIAYLGSKSADRANILAFNRFHLKLYKALFLCDGTE